MGEELVTSGLTALVLVCAGIMLYLAIRFEWRFAVAAILANMHDVVIILGCFALFQWGVLADRAGCGAGGAGLFGERIGGGV